MFGLVMSGSKISNRKPETDFGHNHESCNEDKGAQTQMERKPLRVILANFIQPEPAGSIRNVKTENKYLGIGGILNMNLDS